MGISLLVNEYKYMDMDISLLVNYMYMGISLMVNAIPIEDTP